MPSRYYRRLFSKGFFYHIYNRGVNKSPVFFDKEDYDNFTDILAYYLNFPRGVPLSYKIRSKEEAKPDTYNVPNLANHALPIKPCAYILMPNHFHLVVKQSENPTAGQGISNLLRRLTITYVMYAKKKYDRSGALFEGKFKNVLVDSTYQLLQLTKYIHRNAFELIGSEPLRTYRYSSYPFYLNPGNKPDWLETDEVLSFFSSTNKTLDYGNFVEESKPEYKTIEKIKIE